MYILYICIILQTILAETFYRGGNGGTEWLNNILKATQLGMGKAGVRT